MHNERNELPIFPVVYGSRSVEIYEPMNHSSIALVYFDL